MKKVMYIDGQGDLQGVVKMLNGAYCPAFQVMESGIQVCYQCEAQKTWQAAQKLVEGRKRLNWKVYDPKAKS